MGTRAVEKGQIAEAVAENVKAVRERRGMSQQQLATRLGELGRPMQASAVAKVESGDRRVDVDDLAAFAVALNVSVGRLLVPDVDETVEVRVVSSVGASARDVWQWANGLSSLAVAGEELPDPEVKRRELDFSAERPLWQRVRDDQPLSAATGHLSWVVTQTLASLPSAQQGPKVRAASARAATAWLGKVEAALDDVRRAADRLAAEVAERG